MTHVEGEGYRVEHDPDAARVSCSGTLRLGGLAEYAPIAELLEAAMAQHERLELDLTQLDFLNSSGIATLSKFIITVRDSQRCALHVIGSSSVPWQGKSLKNLQRLMPTLELTFE